MWENCKKILDSEINLFFSLHLQISPLQHPAEFLLYLFFFVAMINQILLPCYFGNEVTLESIAMRDAVYQMNWLEMPIQDRKLLIKYTERLKRPAGIRAFAFYGLNLSTFTTVGGEGELC